VSLPFPVNRESGASTDGRSMRLLALISWDPVNSRWLIPDASGIEVSIFGQSYDPTTRVDMVGLVTVDPTTGQLAPAPAALLNGTSTATLQTAYAAAITPNLSNGFNINVAALTGAITVNNPTNVPPLGTTVSFSFIQDATGGRAVSWGAGFIFPTAWTNVGNTAGKRSTITFTADAFGNLVAAGANVWY